MADDLSLALLNDWQHHFPLQRDPFARIGAALAVSPARVIDAYCGLRASGALSRIGGVFAAGAGGAALLSAMAVPADRLEAVAAIVSAHPGVNHNYEREHDLNLWFVMTGRDAAAVEHAMQGLEAATGLPALRLRMRRAYRIDLGFDLRGAVAPAPRASAAPRLHAPEVAEADRALAALVEAGLPLVERPFDAWADALATPPDAVIATLGRWLEVGTLRRFGAVVRHHELGFAANAMTVFDVPDDQVDACGAALAGEPGVTLAYRRERASGWPFNLYCMVHGRDRGSVVQALDAAIPRCGLAERPRTVLFSRRRFKQVGARRFRELPVAWSPAQEVCDALV
ncbi:Lrp/AsnC family transcriptional regulator [Ideonella sp. A 288]|uniref:siroheme decarboxylase subunit beta n=1 Tax=Ideonella sp. A 288 TaxID=1962181 RepID=UPI002873D826|nr:Lrp/AsnC family transcriptional regulator [Ideonella sp. A 288]